MTQPIVSGQRGAVTRERLVAAALELFATRGFHASTTLLLAERTGIAEGTIYRHFKSKEALYNEVCRRVWARGLELLTDEATGWAPARVRLEGAARRLFAQAQLSPSLIRLLIRPGEPEPLDEEGRRAGERFQLGVVQLVVAGKQDGSIRAGTAELWASVWLAVVGLVCERIADGEWPPDHSNVGLALEAAWSAISRDSSTSPPAPGSGV